MFSLTTDIKIILQASPQYSHQVQQVNTQPPEVRVVAPPAKATVVGGFGGFGGGGGNNDGGDPPQHQRRPAHDVGGLDIGPPRPGCR